MSKKLVNLVWFRTTNVGDTKTSPLDYYKFPLPVEKRDIKEDLSGLEDAFIIVGGGGMIHIPSPDYNNGYFGHFDELKTLGKYRVIWGVGHNVLFPKVKYSGYKFPDVLEDQCMQAINLLPDLSDFHLIGLRDVNYLQVKGARFTPTISCKSSAFKIKDIPKGSGMGAVIHEGTEDTKFPQLYCESSTFPEIISFISQFETIVTNSYHVMCWSEFMNKKVYFHNIQSTKFLLHRRELLQRCIARNDMFYNNVLELIGRYMNE